MSNIRVVGWIGVVIGIVLLLVAFFASQLGLGGAVFGTKHIIALVVGIVLIVLGAYFIWRTPAAR